MRAFAVKAVSKKCGNRWCVSERDWWGEVRSVFGAVREGVRYVRDIHNLDTFQAPNRTLEFGGGDCDDYTITLGSALQAIGFPVKVRIIQSVGAPDYNHVFLLVGMPPRNPMNWYSLDASVDKAPGWHPPKRMIAKLKDYDVS
jgi:transglutaminase-like putative cysteine protease